MTRNLSHKTLVSRPILEEIKLDAPVEENKGHGEHLNPNRAQDKNLKNIQKQFNSFNLSEQDSFTVRSQAEIKREFIKKNGFIN